MNCDCNPNVRCTVESCAYHVADDRCTASKINVSSSSDARTPEQTGCMTFKNRC